MAKTQSLVFDVLADTKRFERVVRLVSENLTALADALALERLTDESDIAERSDG